MIFQFYVFEKVGNVSEMGKVIGIFIENFIAVYFIKNTDMQ